MSTKPSIVAFRKRKKVQKWIQRTKTNIVVLFLVKIFPVTTGSKIEIIILDQQVVNKFRFLVRKMLARMQLRWMAALRDEGDEPAASGAH
jgi:uncharacterized membrane protein